VFGGFTIAAGAKIENARGGSGADIIVANEWVNELTGGAGADVFRFHQVNAGDRITDFGNGADTLDLSAIDARRSTAADEAFILVAAFGKKEGELLLAYDSAANATRVQGDVNGDGIADFELLLNGQVTSTEGWVL
jgi:Ca2+-binding RTX toxin-like protein